jgi:hypothetical protein
VFDDRNDVSEALTRACSGRQDVVGARASDLDGLALMAVKEESLPLRVDSGFLASED